MKQLDCCFINLCCGWQYQCCLCSQFTVESIQKSKRSIPDFISASWKLFFESCGICSFGNSSSCATFSGPLEKFYSFFLISPHHWKKHRKSFLDKMECSLWSSGTVKLNFEKLTSTLKYYMIQRKCRHVNQPRFCPLLVQFFPSELHFFPGVEF